MRVLPLLALSAPAVAAARADATDLTAAPAKPARAKRTPKPAKPVDTIEHVAAPIAPVAPTVDVQPAAPDAPAAEPAVRVAPIARTCATIAAQATNFGGVLSDRDSAYITFYASLAKLTGGTVTVRAIADSGRRPNYAGSSKPHDAGVIVRLTKAGIVAIEADGTSFTFTERGVASKLYASA